MQIMLCSVTPDLYQHRDELSRFIGDEITRAINEQRTLEKRYEELMTQRADLKAPSHNAHAHAALTMIACSQGLANKAKYKAVQEEIQDVSRALKESTNHLVRSLKEIGRAHV